MCHEKKKNGILLNEAVLVALFNFQVTEKCQRLVGFTIQTVNTSTCVSPRRAAGCLNIVSIKLVA